MTRAASSRLQSLEGYSWDLNGKCKMSDGMWDLTAIF